LANGPTTSNTSRLNLPETLQQHAVREKKKKEKERKEKEKEKGSDLRRTNHGVFFAA